MEILRDLKICSDCCHEEYWNAEYCHESVPENINFRVQYLLLYFVGKCNLV